MSQLEELNYLDEIIAGFSGMDRGARSAGPCGLIREHLRAARTALLGAMQGEYHLCLEQAKEAVSCIPEKSARLKTKHMLQILIELRALKSVLPTVR